MKPIAFEYSVDLAPDDDTILVTSPDFPELVTFGDSESDALSHALGAFIAILSARIDDQEDIPLPSPRRKGPKVALPPLIAGKIAVYLAMREQGVSQSELARRLKRDPKQIRRLLDPVNSSRQEHIDAALKALGKKLIVSLADAA